MSIKAVLKKKKRVVCFFISKYVKTFECLLRQCMVQKERKGGARGGEEGEEKEKKMKKVVEEEEDKKEEEDEGEEGEAILAHRIVFAFGLKW